MKYFAFYLLLGLVFMIGQSLLATPSIDIFLSQNDDATQKLILPEYVKMQLEINGYKESLLPYRMMNLYEDKNFIFPESYRQAIFEQDAPMQMITHLHVQSLSYWSHQQEQVGLYNFNFLDFKNLNVAAAEIWQQLVSCNLNDPQLARIHYLMPIENLGLCESETTNGISSDDLKKKLMDLSMNLHAFYQTLDLNWPDIKWNQKKLEESKKYLKYTHPLIVQMLINEWATLLLKIDTNSDMSRSHASMIMVPWLISLLTSDDESSQPLSCSIYGFWPLLNRMLLSINNSKIQLIEFKYPIMFMDAEVKARCSDKENILSTATLWSYRELTQIHLSTLSKHNYVFLESNWDTRNNFEKNVDQMMDDAKAAQSSFAQGYHEAEMIPGLGLIFMIPHGWYKIFTGQ